ncbi:hypothetical protein [Streptomyces sp. e14]|uniref:hypothetical protein n=1 Tax=Streptomyces sp. e14 TaxID=645465 RepID=UPI0012E1AA60|nr:hypothetical protein [Streptomyces sp. e14]
MRNDGQMPFDLGQFTTEARGDREVHGSRQSLLPRQHGKLQFGEQLLYAALENGRPRGGDQELDAEVVVEQRHQIQQAAGRGDVVDHQQNPALHGPARPPT